MQRGSENEQNQEPRIIFVPELFKNCGVICTDWFIVKQASDFPTYISPEKEYEDDFERAQFGKRPGFRLLPNCRKAKLRLDPTPTVITVWNQPKRIVELRFDKDVVGAAIDKAVAEGDSRLLFERGDWLYVVEAHDLSHQTHTMIPLSRFVPIPVGEQPKELSEGRLYEVRALLPGTQEVVSNIAITEERFVGGYTQSNYRELSIVVSHKRNTSA